MANTIRYIDDDSGNHVFPATHERAVFDSEGNTIEPKLQHAQDLDDALTSTDTRTKAQMADYTKYNYYIDSITGLYTTNATYKHIRIKVNPGDYIYVTANSTNGAGVAFLKSNETPEAGGTPDYATGWTNRESVAAGSTRRFVAPADAVILYLYAGTSSSEYAYVPDTVVIREVPEMVKDGNVIHADWESTPGSEVELGEKKVVGGDLLSDLLLDDSLFDVKTITSTEGLCIRSRSLRTNGTYGDTGYYHAHIYVKPGDIIRYRQPSGSYEGRCAFVTAFSFVNVSGTAVPLVTGTKVQVVAAGTEALFRVPTGAAGFTIYLGSYDSGAGKYSNMPSKIEIYSPKGYEQPEGSMAGIPANGYVVASGAIATETSRTAWIYPLYPGYRYIMKLVADSASVTDYYALLPNIPTTGMEVTNNGTRNNQQGAVQEYMVNTPSFLLVTAISGRISGVTAYRIDGSGSMLSDIDTLIDSTEYVTPSLVKRENYIVQYRGNWTNSSETFHYRIPINGEKWVKMTAGSGARTRYAFLTGTGNNSDNVAKFVANEGIRFIGASATQIIAIPSDAVYLYIYYGASSYEGPSYIGLTKGVAAAATESGLAKAQRNDLTAKLAASAAAVGLYPLDRSLDGNNREIPRTLQQQVVVWKCNQMAKLHWTPKNTIPGKNRDYSGGTLMENGIPYSSNMQDFKHVGIEVSIHTFMTAVNNPYSLLYTEVVGGSGATSIWGRVYGNSNGYAYYGTVCCGLTSAAVGAVTKYGNTVHDNFARYLGIFRPVSKKGKVNWKLLEIGDVFDDDSHACIVVGIERDNSGNITGVVEAESVAGQQAVGACYIRSKTISAFETLIGSSYKMTHYKYTPLFENVTVEDASAYINKDGTQPASAPTYNNDICTVYGDKACLAVGDLVVINYNLTASPSHTWTAVEVYKDDTLLGTYTLADINQSALPEVERGHALNLGTELAAGKYKARMTDGNNNSDYTYWEILPQDIEITKIADGVYEVSNNAEAEMVYVYLGQQNANDARTFTYARCGRPLEYYERENKRFVLYADDLINEFGVAQYKPMVMRIMCKGDYGLAATATMPLE